MCVRVHLAVRLSLSERARLQVGAMLLAQAVVKHLLLLLLLMLMMMLMLLLMLHHPRT